MEKTVKENNFANGSVKISNDIINRISAVACLETEGVVSISGFSGDAVSGKIKKDFTKSVGVKIDGNSVNISLNIIVKREFIIPEVCLNVQKNVKEKVEIMTGLKVNAVNIEVEKIQ